MKKITILLMTITSIYSLSANLIIQQDAEKLVAQIVNDFFHEQLYPHKELCKKNAIYNLYKYEQYQYGQFYYDDALIRRETLDRIAGNIIAQASSIVRKTIKSFSLARDQQDFLIEKIIKNITLELDSITMEKNILNGYTKFLDGCRTLTIKVQKIIQQDLTIVVPTCCLDNSTNNLIKLSCGHYMCKNCALEVDSFCKKNNKPFTCLAPECGKNVDSDELQKQLHGYFWRLF